MAGYGNSLEKRKLDAEWTVEENTVMTGHMNDTDQDEEAVDAEAEAELELFQSHGDSHEATRSRRTWRLVVLGLLVAALVGAAVGAYFGVTGKNNESGSENTESAGATPPAAPGDKDLSGEPPSESPPAPGTPTAAATFPPTTAAAAMYRDIIFDVARFGGTEFSDPESYQSRALAWVQTQSLPTGSNLSLDEEVTQLYALACIYMATYSARSSWTDEHYGVGNAIPGWLVRNGWLEDPSSVCTMWYGIKCNTEGRVKSIDLSGNGLSGTFPPEVVLLKDTLEEIDLFKNVVANKGDEGHAFFGELVNLKHLFYGSTNFEYDGIPTYLNQLVNLEQYDCSETLMFGPLRDEAFSNLNNLAFLALDGNEYGQEIPATLYQLPKLEYLFLSGTNVYANLEFIKDMPSIIELWLDDNPGFSNQNIPASIGQASKLESLSMGRCGLVGALPTEIGDLNKLQQLWLHDNPITGNVPTEIANLRLLKKLELHNTDLTGEISSGICFLRNPVWGSLEFLTADCDDEVSCPTDCCTCCGSDCSDTN